MMPPLTRIAADVGGTFTNVAVLTADGGLATRKLPSTPANYADAVIDGITGLVAALGSPLGAGGACCTAAPRNRSSASCGSRRPGRDRGGRRSDAAIRARLRALAGERRRLSYRRFGILSSARAFA
jgi:Hydantoinase/oxoprolinase N-terminal region